MSHWLRLKKAATQCEGCGYTRLDRVLHSDSYFCRTNSSVTTFFTSPNSSCFSLQHPGKQTCVRSHESQRDAALNAGDLGSSHPWLTRSFLSVLQIKPVGGTRRHQGLAERHHHVLFYTERWHSLSLITPPFMKMRLRITNRRLVFGLVGPLCAHQYRWVTVLHCPNSGGKHTSDNKLESPLTHLVDGSSSPTSSLLISM